MFELITDDGKMLVIIDDEQSVAVETYIGESVVGRVVLRELDAMELANILFEELEVREDS
jgi:hypothetical protein